LMFDVSTTFANGVFSFGTDIPVVTFNAPSPAGRHFIPPQPGRGIPVLPVLAVDDSAGPNRGKLYIAYDDIPASGSSPDFDIFLFTSSDQGATWTSPLRVNDDTGTNSQFSPWITVDPSTGCVLASWRDARNDPADRKVDFFSGLSMDGGATFENY